MESLAGSSASASAELLEAVPLVGWQYLMLGVLGIIIGLSSVSIGFSAWPLLVPLMIGAWNVRVFEALFVSGCVDFVNSVVILAFFSYEKRVVYRVGGVSAVVSGLAALGALQVAKLIVESELAGNVFRGLVGPLILLIGFGLFFKAVRFRSKVRKAQAALAQRPDANVDETAMGSVSGGATPNEAFVREEVIYVGGKDSDDEEEWAANHKQTSTSSASSSLAQVTSDDDDGASRSTEGKDSSRSSKRATSYQRGSGSGGAGGKSARKGKGRGGGKAKHGTSPSSARRPNEQTPVNASSSSSSAERKRLVAAARPKRERTVTPINRLSHPRKRMAGLCGGLILAGILQGVFFIGSGIIFIAFYVGILKHEQTFAIGTAAIPVIVPMGVCIIGYVLLGLLESEAVWIAVLVPAVTSGLTAVIISKFFLKISAVNMNFVVAFAVTVVGFWATVQVLVVNVF